MESGNGQSRNLGIGWTGIRNGLSEIWDTVTEGEILEQGCGKSENGKWVPEVMEESEMGC